MVVTWSALRHGVVEVLASATTPLSFREVIAHLPAELRRTYSRGEVAQILYLDFLPNNIAFLVPEFRWTLSELNQVRDTIPGVKPELCESWETSTAFEDIDRVLFALSKHNEFVHPRELAKDIERISGRCIHPFVVSGHLFNLFRNSWAIRERGSFRITDSGFERVHTQGWQELTPQQTSPEECTPTFEQENETFQNSIAGERQPAINPRSAARRPQFNELEQNLLDFRGGDELPPGMAAVNSWALALTTQCRDMNDLLAGSDECPAVPSLHTLDREEVPARVTTTEDFTCWEILDGALQPTGETLPYGAPNASGLAVRGYREQVCRRPAFAKIIHGEEGSTELCVRAVIDHERYWSEINYWSDILRVNSGLIEQHTAGISEPAMDRSPNTNSPTPLRAPPPPRARRLPS